MKAKVNNKKATEPLIDGIDRDSKRMSRFMLSPHYQVYRHLLLQLIVVMITINVLWYDPLQSTPFIRRLGGFLAYYAVIDSQVPIKKQADKLCVFSSCNQSACNHFTLFCARVAI